MSAFKFWLSVLAIAANTFMAGLCAHERAWLPLALVALCALQWAGWLWRDTHPTCDCEGEA